MKKVTPSGLSLLEVVIAAVIFSTAVVSFLGIWTLYQSALSKARNQLMATSLARSTLEERVASGFSVLDTIAGQEQVSTVTSRFQVRGRFAQTSYTTRFLATKSPASPWFLRLIARVEWDESSEKKEVVYETCLYRTH